MDFLHFFWKNGFSALHTDLAFLGAVLQTFMESINYQACPKRDILFKIGGISNHMLTLSDKNWTKKKMFMIWIFQKSISITHQALLENRHFIPPLFLPLVPVFLCSGLKGLLVQVVSSNKDTKFLPQVCGDGRQQLVPAGPSNQE